MVLNLLRYRERERVGWVIPTVQGCNPFFLREGDCFFIIHFKTSAYGGDGVIPHSNHAVRQRGSGEGSNTAS